MTDSSSIDSRVYLAWGEPTYPESPYQSGDSAHQALAQLFEAWGLDPKNPFASFVKPGETALIKPNWVRDFNPNGSDLTSLISHTSLIHHLIDHLANAMEGRGTVVIADAPLQNCNFKQLTERNGIHRVVDFFSTRYPELKIVVEDWRLTVMARSHFLTGWTPDQQTSSDGFGQAQSASHRVVDLGENSFLEDISDYADRFRVTCYKPSLMKAHHQPGKHEYLITNRVFQVDFMINLSKMKTHIKAGVTGALKSLIGINGHKEYLPHHIKGPWFKGGDNYLLPNWFRERYEDFYDRYWESFSELRGFKKKIWGLALQVLWKLSLLFGREWISAASWRGNETVWRTTLDLNHALYFFSPERPRKIINIIDGLVAGEGEGPLSPTEKPIGVLIGGENPAYVDAVMTKLIGYNLSRIPTVYHAVTHRDSRFADVPLRTFEVKEKRAEKPVTTVRFRDLPSLHFKKPRYWRGA